MRVESTICDRCGKGNTKKFHIFKERKYNGVDTENWYYVFDLCFDCAERVINLFLETPVITAIDLIKSIGVKVRVE